MILQEFPDISWLKNQIDQGFSNKLGWGNLLLDTEGFPSVIIHTRSEECFRPDIKGPISLFLNIRGNSLCKVDGITRQVSEDTYFISNRSQPYTLQIERGQPTETFNIHFGEYFAESVLNALLTPADSILERGRQQDVSFFQFFNQLHRRAVRLNGLVLLAGIGLLIAFAARPAPRTAGIVELTPAERVRFDNGVNQVIQDVEAKYGLRPPRKHEPGESAERDPLIDDETVDEIESFYARKRARDQARARRGSATDSRAVQGRVSPRMTLPSASESDATRPPGSGQR